MEDITPGLKEFLENENSRQPNPASRDGLNDGIRNAGLTCMEETHAGSFQGLRCRAYRIVKIENRPEKYAFPDRTDIFRSIRMVLLKSYKKKWGNLVKSE